jgi:hypothetical protein
MSSKFQASLGMQRIGLMIRRRMILTRGGYCHGIF